MPPTAEHRERPGHTVKGPSVVAATLSLFLLIPAITVVISLAVKPEKPEALPLDWDERVNWPRTFFTTFKSLERGMMSNARTNEVYKDLGFHLEPETQLAVIRCTALAKQPREVFSQAASRRQLEDELEALPDLFYAHFLLATWYQTHGRDTLAETHLRQAFAHAPASLMRHHVHADDTDAAHAAVPTLAFAADQVVDDRLDRSVVLVFPHLTTDAEGFIYLPVFKAILRPEDPALPAGVVDQREKYPWFTFVGRIGRLPDVVLPPEANPSGD